MKRVKVRCSNFFLLLFAFSYRGIIHKNEIQIVWKKELDISVFYNWIKWLKVLTLKDLFVSSDSERLSGWISICKWSFASEVVGSIWRDNSCGCFSTNLFTFYSYSSYPPPPLRQMFWNHWSYMNIYFSVGLRKFQTPNAHNFTFSAILNINDWKQQKQEQKQKQFWTEIFTRYK